MPDTDREQVYARCKQWIKRHTIAHPEQRAVTVQQLKLTYCAHGPMRPAQVDTALQALEEQGVILRADGWVTIDTDDAAWVQQALEYAAGREDPPQAFIGACNQRKQELQA